MKSYISIKKQSFDIRKSCNQNNDSSISTNDLYWHGSKWHFDSSLNRGLGNSIEQENQADVFGTERT